VVPREHMPCFMTGYELLPARHRSSCLLFIAFDQWSVSQFHVSLAPLSHLSFFMYADSYKQNHIVRISRPADLRVVP
jgi:hypothetical protein